MLEVLTTTAPIFLLIALGFTAVKTALMPQEAIPGLGHFVLYFALPALIISTLGKMEFASVIDPAYMLVYGSASIIALVLGILISKHLLHDNLTGSGVKALGMSISNSAFFGYPVLLLTFEHPPTNAFAMCLIIENMIVVPLALVTIEYSIGRSNGMSLAEAWKGVLVRVIRNPLIIAIAAGITLSALELQLPGPVEQSLEMLARTSASIALFVVGGSLVSSRLRGNLTEIGTVAAGKLILHPLLVALMVMLVPGMDPQLKAAAILMASMPMMSVYPIVGGNYGYRELCSSILLATTVLSFIAISVTLALVL
ncbi:malonate transporter [Marinobacterium nitratireducens]|uniref:Malonate transporter n=1 Tax=Marinobacterium nitratireducens TaxID=518897 RepID=A0A917ZNG8_9GAMM|nr:AEC family transporter [Marinobacterium nitratireducens]GGO85902.1 malonate transporter [Marinobacterium nitratireducens]